jgi:hypothetical protein
MTTAQQIKAAALQAAVQTLALFPESIREAVISENKDNAGREGVFYSSILATAQKYVEYLQQE